MLPSHRQMSSPADAVAPEATSPLVPATLDHVAIAVDDVDAAHEWWRSMGAVPVAGGSNGGFRTEQLALGNGAKVELIGRPVDGADATFIDAFLQRFGSGTIHHLTVKVPGPIRDAAALVQAAGYDVVDVSDRLPFWHEGFLRPSQVGGLIVQIAWTTGGDVSFAERVGRPPPARPDPTAPELLRVRLRHPDLGRAAAMWSLLGASIDWHDEAGRLLARWPGSPLEVEVVRGEAAGPVGLVMAGIPPQAADALVETVPSPRLHRAFHPDLLQE